MSKQIYDVCEVCSHGKNSHDMRGQCGVCKKTGGPCKAPLLTGYSCGDGFVR
jgi:hypothetical protein